LNHIARQQEEPQKHRQIDEPNNSQLRCVVSDLQLCSEDQAAAPFSN
jgi:hypothetical protein